MNQQATIAFKDPTSLTRWAKGFLYAGIAIKTLVSRDRNQ